MSDRSTVITHLNNARATLTLYVGKLNEAKTLYTQCGNTLGKLNEAKTLHDQYRQYLQNAYTVLDQFRDDLLASSTADKESALLRFGLTLAPDSATWQSDNGQRIQNAYQAVINIINRISSELFCSDTVLGAMQFKQNFNGTELQIVQGSNPNDAAAAASTGIVDRDGVLIPVIYLYTMPTNSPNHIHTPENIIHEFGHVLVFRNGQDNSAIYMEWTQSFTQYISPFDPEDGWGANAINLQNRSTTDKEQERIANMFEAWVKGYTPDLVYDPNSPAGQRLHRAYWALWSFMTATPPPYDPTALDDPTKTVWIDLTRQVRPVGSGILYWIKLYGDY